MACGCVDRCSCSVVGQGIVNVAGSGDFSDPYVVTASETPFAAVNTDGGISITGNGPNGHEPIIDLNIDPASTAPVSVGPSGLRVDCCEGVGSEVFYYLAHLDAVQDIEVAGSTILWDAEDADIGFGAAVGSSIAVPTDGLYDIHTQVRYDYANKDENARLSILVNGTIVATVEHALTDAVNADTQMQCGRKLALIAGDLVSVEAAADTATTAVTGVNNTFLSIVRLSA